MSAMPVIGRLFLLVLTFALSAALFAQGVAASKMSLDMAATEHLQLEGDDDCSACSDDDVASLAACQTICGAPVVALQAAPAEVVPLRATGARHPTSRVRLQGQVPGHDPHPPRTFILA